VKTKQEGVAQMLKFYMYKRGSVWEEVGRRIEKE
jgi:hypothetical protein